MISRAMRPPQRSITIPPAARPFNIAEAIRGKVTVER
jgi:hypothetical protein